DLDKKVNRLLPQYMTMGQSGMSEMAEMNMGGPANMAEMSWDGPFGSTAIGGMATVVKIRHELNADSAMSWYKHPPEYLAKPATKDDLERDGIKPVEPKHNPTHQHEH